ncbi:MAG: DUF881 domain-containing protein [Actinobacteria bacterium]|nr:DUF881 domain-containing protein [Actinomycetota bacterium]
MKKNWHLSLVLVYMVLGVLLATSFNTQQEYYESLNTPRKKDLINTMRKLESERDRFKKQIEDDRKQVLRYEEVAAKEQGIQASYTKELERTKTAAGLVQAKGPGLVVTLSDNPQYPKDGQPNNYIIHDYDIRAVVNSLWVGGAEAISINGQRLISTSSIRCAGVTIWVDSEGLVPPFVIKAIGDPRKMMSALNADDKTRQLLNEVADLYGLFKKIEQKDELVVPGYTGALPVDNARIIEGG